MRKSHEAVDVATKADIVEVNRNIADVRKDLSAEINLRFEKVDAQISNVCKDMAVRFEKTDGQVALIRKDVETIAAGLLLKFGGVIVVTISAATAILKFF
ncbi:MAG: hypothetical protein ACL7BU_09555 [Candidatus Phlomobacter fragariae]